MCEETLTHLTELPALIDPHVHFRTPGHTYKEDWLSGALACIRGGVTTVLDMPNTEPPTLSIKALKEKKKIIDAQLKSVGIPLHYGLYIGADQHHLGEIKQAKGHAVAIKAYMGCSTGNLYIGSDKALESLFEIAARDDWIVAVHAEEEAMINAHQEAYSGVLDPSLHSKIRHRDAAIFATNKAISLAKRFGTKLYIVHLSTKEELDLVRQARLEGIKVFAEVSPHHLFLDTSAYGALGTLAQMNPPLREKEDCEALWEGISDGTIDTIGTDHAPHTLEEKKLPYGQALSGVPGVETLLPLLLNAVHEGRLSCKRLIALTRTNAQKIFNLLDNDDVVFVDLDLKLTVDETKLKTKCGWTPYAGWELTGWPIFTKIGNTLFPAAGYDKKTWGKTLIGSVST